MKALMVNLTKFGESQIQTVTMLSDIKKFSMSVISSYRGISVDWHRDSMKEIKKIYIALVGIFITSVIFIVIITVNLWVLR